MRCQFTMLGFHSVAKDERSRVTAVEPQLGHGGRGAEGDTSSSNRFAHASQRYS